jgi:hypothetical protein
LKYPVLNFFEFFKKLRLLELQWDSHGQHKPFCFENLPVEGRNLTCFWFKIFQTSINVLQIYWLVYFLFIGFWWTDGPQKITSRISLVVLTMVVMMIVPICMVCMTCMYPSSWSWSQSVNKSQVAHCCNRTVAIFTQNL